MASFDMTDRIGPSYQLQGRLYFVTDVPVGVQGGIGKRLIMKTRRTTMKFQKTKMITMTALKKKKKKPRLKRLLYLYL